MRKDPIVEEIHRIRREHAKRFNYDLNAIFADIRKREADRKNLSTLQPVKPALPCVAEERAAYRARRSRLS
jgi:hypothetical protein